MELKEFRNLKVGEKFNLGYKRFEVKRGDGTRKDCKLCYFKNNQQFCNKLTDANMLPCCFDCDRQDEEYVYFVEVENESKN